MHSDKEVDIDKEKEVNRDALKQTAARLAATLVQDGMAVGLGTGSTATYVIAELIRRHREENLRFVALPTSERSGQQARDGGLTLVDFATNATLDLTIDGADQVQRGSLALIKGLGGALLREKIVAAASARLVIVVDDQKLADHFTVAVPVEVERFGWQATQHHLRKLGATPTLRTATTSPFVTDGGNFILDCDFGSLDDAGPLDRALHDTVGVIETGYFLNRASLVIVAAATGTIQLTRA